MEPQDIRLMQPGEYIVPVFGVAKRDGAPRFLGTGTFVGKQPWVATAAHVVRDYKGPLGITPFPDFRLAYAKIAVRDDDADLALLKVENYSPPYTLDLAEDDEIVGNQMVLCFEYGPTTTVGKITELSPATRIGNVTRMLHLEDRFHKAGDCCLELSFPALRGASGAPIISNSTTNLWGIVIANYNYHLLPAQIESVLDEKNEIYEETKFMLPQGIAVHVKHLRALVEKISKA